MLQGGEIPFWPHTAEGWLALLARVFSGAIIAAAAVWRLLSTKIDKNREACTKALVQLGATLREERGNAIERIRDEREVIRQEIKRDISDEVEDRKVAIQNLTERQVDLAQKLHNLMGEVKLMSDRIHEDRLAQQKELAALRLEMAQGFLEMRDTLRDGLRECAVANRSSRRSE